MCASVAATNLLPSRVTSKTPSEAAMASWADPNPSQTLSSTGIAAD